MSIRIDLANTSDAAYSEQVGLPEVVSGLVEEVVLKKPEKTELTEVMGSILGAEKPPVAGKFLNRVGNTPLVEIPSPNPLVKIYAKCEFMNPTGSIKDRIAEHILNSAEKTGTVKKGTTVVAASSGNTGSAIAMACSSRGYKCKIFTNSKCSEEKINAVRAYGGEIVVGPTGIPADHPDHYQNLALAAAAEPNSYDVDQYDNAANPEAYYLSLGPEIWEQTKGEVTHFVAAGSTGGTISGVGRYLKEQQTGVQVILADPHGSCFSDFYREGTHNGATSFLVEGVGKDSIPGAMDFKLVDYAIQISDSQAIKCCHTLAQEEGMLVGGSSGLNVAAAQEIAKTLTKPSTIVTICPDTGLKYLSKYYNADWLEKQGVFLDEERFTNTKRYQKPVVHGPEMKHASLK
eukprot:TRINITY_DN7286_c0_g1_i1.p1 TRINITY_DN7286_c0_g1~~TRINITY_DN7286_c0_g1_i1.p1  ORF type:complete len:403 (+),score=105.24 TRINITY_DN7286_c0_g1_i1:64-1272(+)